MLTGPDFELAASRSPGRSRDRRILRSWPGIGAAVLLACGILAVFGMPGFRGLAATGGAGASRTVRHEADVTRLSRGTTTIGLATDPVTGGYWILKSNGGVGSFHAPWYGSLLNKVPAGSVVTAIAAGRPDGYLVLTSNGGVHPFGTPWHGSDAGKLPAGVTAVGLAGDAATGGYWILRSDGKVDNFDAPRHGSLTNPGPADSAVLTIAAGRPGGYLVLVSRGTVPDGYANRWLTVIPTSRKVVALTFDLGAPNIGGTRRVLTTLRQDHVPATFFLIGAWVNRFPSLAKEIVHSGVAIGDLSLTHQHFPRISDTEMRLQVLSAQNEIKRVTGAQAWPWFRFPFGEYDAHTIAVVNSVGFATIGWTVDTLGWEGSSGGITVQSMVDRVIAGLQPGEIVLMHPAATVDHSTLDADALPAVIKAVRSYGYSFVTINALRRHGFHVPRAVARVHNFGTPWYGSDARKIPAGVTAVGLAEDPETGGYWILNSDGSVVSFHASSHGSLLGKVPPGNTVTAIAAGLHGGYLILTSNGRVYAFGTPWYGSDAIQRG